MCNATMLIKANSTIPGNAVNQLDVLLMSGHL